jgi:hypothetical protein
MRLKGGNHYFRTKQRSLPNRIGKASDVLYNTLLVDHCKTDHFGEHPGIVGCRIHDRRRICRRENLVLNLGAI